MHVLMYHYVMDKVYGLFIWNTDKESENIRKHRVSFIEAVNVFRDPKRKIITDELHSQQENRYFCIGSINNRILTVRFTYRGNSVRIIGAGYWREGRKYYEKKD